jgi:single-strand DNA-binding protein
MIENPPMDTSRVRLSVASNERWHDKQTGERHERTEWHTVVFWDRLAHIAADYVRKGSHILVSGAIKSRQYEDKGGSKTVWEVHARELLLLDPRTSEVEQVGESDEPAPAPQSAPA